MSQPPALTQGRVSFAQNAEDVRLWRALDSIAEGRYVEVGAWDPTDDSVSRSFYDRGWSGVVVEPVAQYAQAFSEQRPRDTVAQVLAGAEEGARTIHTVPGTGLSTTSQEHAAKHQRDGFEIIDVDVPMRPVSALLDDAGLTDIHFMVIDTEGAEADVLAGLDLQRHRPWVLVIEATDPKSSHDSSAQWEPMVTSAGYVFAAFDGLNRFYVADEHSELAGALAVPPNALDGYITLREARLAEAVDEAKAAGAAAGDHAKHELVALEARLELTQAQLRAARHNTEIALEQRDELQRKLERYGIAQARRAVTFMRRARARLKRL